MIFAIIACGLIISSQLNSFLLRKYKSQQIIRVALFCQSTIGILLVTGSYLGWIEMKGTVVLILLFLSSQGFTFPNSSALSLAPFAKTAGSASALMGGIQMGVGALTSAIVSWLANGTTLPMTGVMSACSLSAFTVLMIGHKIIAKNARLDDVEEEAVEMII
jgi:MFS transporter, DHA1 family, multidrug resistance protein